MRIDSHQHFWKYDAVRHSWLNDAMRKIRKDFLPSDLKPILLKNNMDGCIAVQVDQTETETEFLLQLAAENSFIKGVVGWVDLLSDDAEERLVHYSKYNSFKGVRHIVQEESDDFMLGTEFQNGIRSLSQCNLTYDILIYPSQLSAAIALVEKFPNQKFIINHIAKPAITTGLDEYWVHGMQELGKHENVFCKLSGMVTETQQYKWNKNDFASFLDVVVNAFGIDKVLFGSDWPVCLVAGEYHEVLQIITDYFANYSKTDLDKMMGGNAIKFYNIS
ncbi:MAG: amidohydrolase [Flavobacteriaceae bacterium]|nr:MAG: amidohydrolase [Flavobacteriaceae bacterium]